MRPESIPAAPAGDIPPGRVQVRHVERSSGGSFVAEDDGGRRIATADYQLAQERGIPVAVIHHTWTDPGRRGQGLAAITVEAAVANARERGWRILPTCSYAAALFRRHRDWGELLA